jgi:hypothetical protein
MTDDDLFAQLRDLPAGDVDGDAVETIRRRGHAALRRRGGVAAIVRTVEPIVVTGVAIAQLAWAWSVVLS